MNNGYPFLTKNEIKAQIASSDDFVISCLLTLQSRQTEYEQETRTTRDRNHRGWMSSHAVWAARLCSALNENGSLTEDELSRARSMVSRYSTQLARHFRNTAQEQSPELAERGRVFGV